MDGAVERERDVVSREKGRFKREEKRREEKKERKKETVIGKQHIRTPMLPLGGFTSAVQRLSSHKYKIRACDAR